jgi:hypothetical protein
MRRYKIATEDFKAHKRAMDGRVFHNDIDENFTRIMFCTTRDEKRILTTLAEHEVHIEEIARHEQG